MAPRDYDSTVARIAGNIFSGLAGRVYSADRLDDDETFDEESPQELGPPAAKWCVQMARIIVDECKMGGS